MTLPFDIPDKNKRKYQCFVCGVYFEEFEQFKTHIVETHEEGREYIVCPCDHCQAPVRDLRMHFKVKHPHMNMPPVAMTKAIVMKDLSAKGKVKNKKPQFREGWYHSTKMNKKIHYRSGYESTIYELLDADVDVLAFEEEPFKIAYLHKGKQHQYIPDILVRFITGRIEIWEVKPANQTLLEQNQNKWSAAADVCKTRGWDFVVITEKGITNLKTKVKNQFLGL